jgi:WD40 repeat protein
MNGRCGGVCVIAVWVVSVFGRLIPNWAQDSKGPGFDIQPLPVRIPGTLSRITGLAFSPDGETLAASHGWWDGEGMCQVWDLTSGQRVALQEVQAGSPGVGWTAGTNDLVVGDWQNAVRVFAFPSLEKRAELTIEKSVGRFAISPDGTRIVTVAEGQEDKDESRFRFIKIWDARTGELVRTAHGDEGMFRLGCVTWSPKGTYIAAGGGRYQDQIGDVRIWSAEDDKEIAKLEGHTAFVRALEFFPEEDRIVTCGLDNTLRIWDVKSGKELARFNGRSLLDSLDISSDGSLIAIGGYNGEVLLWDVAAGKLLDTLGPVPTALHSVTFSPDDRLLASGGDDGVIRLWNVQTRRIEKELPEEATFDRPGTPTALAASPDGCVAYVGYANGRLCAIDAREQKVLWELKAVAVRAATSLTTDGARLLVGWNDGLVQIVSAADGEVLTELKPMPSGVMATDLSLDGRLVALGDSSGRVQIRELATDVVKAEFVERLAAIMAVKLSSDGSVVTSIMSNGPARRTDVVTGEVQGEVNLGETFIRQARFSADGSTLIAVGTSASVWDAASLMRRSTVEIPQNSTTFAAALTSNGSHAVVAWGAGILLVRGDNGEVVKSLAAARRPATMELAFSADDRRLFQSEQAGELAVWQAVPEPKEPLAERAVKGNAVAVAVSPDGKWLAAGGDDSQASVWNLETGDLVRTFPTNGTLYVCRFSPDSQLLATGSLGGMVKVWNLKTGSLEGSFFENAQGIRSMAFSPDGRWLATGGMDKCLRVIDLRRWEVVHQQPSQPVWVEGVAFSPSGKHLYSVTGSWDPGDQPAKAMLTKWKVMVAEGGSSPLMLEAVKTIEAHAVGSENVAVTDDGKWVVTPSGDGTIRVWDAESLDLIRTVAFGSGVHRLQLLKGDRPLAVAGGQLGGISVWDLSTGENVVRYTGHGSHVFDVAATPDGRMIVSAGEDDRYRFWAGPVGRPDGGTMKFLERVSGTGK